MKSIFAVSRVAAAVSVALLPFSSGLLAQTVDLGGQTVINNTKDCTGQDVTAPGNLTITSNGKLTVGTFTGQGSLLIQQGGTMTSAGQVTANRFDNQGKFEGSDVRATGSQYMYNTGSAVLSGSMVNEAENGVIQNKGSLQISGNISSKLQLSQTSGASLTFAGSDVQKVETRSVILNGGVVTVNEGASVDGSSADWQVLKDAKVTGAGLLKVGKMLLASEGDQVSEMSVATLDAKEINNQAKLTSGKVIVATRLINDSKGTINVGSITAASGSSVTNDGTMTVGTFDGAQAALTNKKGGTLSGNQLMIGSLTNQGSLSLTGDNASLVIGTKLDNSGQMKIGKSLVAADATLKNSGTISGADGGDLEEVRVKEFTNEVQGTITTNNLTVSHKMYNNGKLTVNNDLVGPEAGIITNRGTLVVGGDVSAGSKLTEGNGVVNLATIKFTGKNSTVRTNVFYNSKDGKAYAEGGALAFEGQIQNNGLIARSETEALESLKTQTVLNFQTGVINVVEMNASDSVTNLGKLNASGTVTAQTLDNREDATLTASALKTEKEGHRGHLTNKGVMTVTGEVEVLGHFGNLATGQFKAGTLTTSNATDSGTLFEVENLNLEVSPEQDKGLGYFDFMSEGSVAKIGTLTAEKGQLKVFGKGVEIETVNNDSTVIFQVDDLQPGKAKVGTNNGSLSVEVPEEITDTLDPDNLSASLQKVADTVTIEKGDRSKEVRAEAGTILGDLQAGTDAAGNIVSVKESANEFNIGISEMASIAMMAWRAENNDMFKRLGDVRRGDDNNGLWVRVMAGESEYGTQNLENEYTTFQFGYDHRVGAANEWILGGAFTYTNGESTFDNGSGDNYQYGFALYGSYLAESGGYVDVIGKYSRLNNEFEADGGIGSGEYYGNGLSLSIEAGHRFGNCA